MVSCGIDLIVNLILPAARIDRQPFWSQARGTPQLENAPPANLQDFGDFCTALAARYRGIGFVQRLMAANSAWVWRRNPRFRVAYAAAGETISYGVARWTEAHLGELFERIIEAERIFDSNAERTKCTSDQTNYYRSPRSDECASWSNCN